MDNKYSYWDIQEDWLKLQNELEKNKEKLKNLKKRNLINEEKKVNLIPFYEPEIEEEEEISKISLKNKIDETVRKIVEIKKKIREKEEKIKWSIEIERECKRKVKEELKNYAKEKNNL